MLQVANAYKWTIYFTFAFCSYSSQTHSLYTMINVFLNVIGTRIEKSVALQGLKNIGALPYLELVFKELRAN